MVTLALIATILMTPLPCCPSTIALICGNHWFLMLCGTMIDITCGASENIIMDMVSGPTWSDQVVPTTAHFSLQFSLEWGKKDYILIT